METDAFLCVLTVTMVVVLRRMCASVIMAMADRPVI